MAKTQSSRPSRKGRYLYAVSGVDLSAPKGLRGIGGQPVQRLTEGSVAAWVSSVARPRLRPERRHVAAHHEVLKALMAAETVLPMAFGTISPGPTAVRRLLAANQESLHGQLDRVRHKVEMGLNVRWDVPSIFEYLLRSVPELRTERDRLFGSGREPSHDERIELGRLVDRVLDSQRQQHRQRIEEVLAPACSELQWADPRDELEVVNAGFLVLRDQVDQFEKAIFAAAQHFDDNFTFDYSGPWPPSRFVDLRLVFPADGA